MQAEVAKLREQCHRNTDAAARCEVLSVQVNDLSDLLAASRESREEREDLQAQASICLLYLGVLTVGTSLFTLVLGESLTSKVACPCALFSSAGLLVGGGRGASASQLPLQGRAGGSSRLIFQLL